jgi:hypothetical protein
MKIGQETVRKLLATIMERQDPVRKIPQDPWFCFLEQEPLETGSQEKVKGGILSAGNDLTNPIYRVGKSRETVSNDGTEADPGKNEESCRTSPITIGQEVEGKLLATTG